MNTMFFEEMKGAVQNWWTSLVLGILFIGLGILLMFQPVAAYEALVVLFSVSMFVNGLLEVYFSLSNRRTMPSWGWYLACGIIDVILGLALMCFPFVTAEVIPFVLAFWIMFSGFNAIGYSMDMSRFHAYGWGWNLVFGLLAVFCSLAIIWQPASGALAAVYIMAFAFIFIGFARVMLSFTLRDMHKHNAELKEKISAQHRG
jgi:uncharacterized membrane protein HdeD (DUF308 family)